MQRIYDFIGHTFAFTFAALCGAGFMLWIVSTDSEIRTAEQHVIDFKADVADYFTNSDS